MKSKAENKILIYTFKPFPWIYELQELYNEVFIFNRVKTNLELLYKKIDELDPNYIVGVAKARKSYSQFETIATNAYGSKNKIDKEGKDFYNLYVLKIDYSKYIKISHVATNSFCNYSMYKISQYIEARTIKLSFAHVRHLDLEDLLRSLKLTR